MGRRTASHAEAGVLLRFFEHTLGPVSLQDLQFLMLHRLGDFTSTGYQEGGIWRYLPVHLAGHLGYRDRNAKLCFSRFVTIGRLVIIRSPSHSCMLTMTILVARLGRVLWQFLHTITSNKPALASARPDGTNRHRHSCASSS